jgi:hypothetical protein
MNLLKLTSNNFLINLKWLIIGIGIIVLGFSLMYSKPVNQFNEFDHNKFSFIHLSLAPIFVVTGYLVVGISIFKKN